MASYQYWRHPELERCMCWDSEANDWCDSYWSQCKSYWESTYSAAAPAVFAAAIVAIFVAFYFLSRVLTCLKVVTCCLVRRSVSKGGVSESCVSAFRKTHASLFVLLLITAITTTAFRAGSINKGVHDINDSLSTIRQDMNYAAQIYRSTSMNMVAVLSDNIPNDISFEIQNQARNVQRWTTDISNVQSKVMTYQWTIDLVLWIPVFFTVLLIFLSAVRVRRIVPEIMVLIMLPVVVTVYVLQASFGGLSVVASDVCDDYWPMSETAQQMIKSNLKCDKTGTAMGRMFNTTDILLNAYLNETCGENGCVKGFECNVNCSSLQSAAAMLKTGSVLTDVSARGRCLGNCSIQQCAEKCQQGSDAQLAAEKAVILNQQTVSFNRSMVYDVYPLASCRIFNDAVEYQYQNLCSQFKSKLEPYAVFAGIGCFLVSFVLICFGLLNCLYPSDESQNAKLADAPVLVPGSIGVPILDGAPVTSYGTVAGKPDQLVFDPVVKPVNAQNQAMLK